MRFTQLIVKNKIATTITFLSLLSLIPFGFFFNYANELNELQNINSLDPAHATKVLTRSVDLPELYLPFIFGVFVWVANGSLSAFGLARKKLHLVFALGTLVLGGLGIHIVILISKFVPWNRFVPQLRLNRILKVSSTITLGTTITVAPFMVAIFAKSFEDPSIAPVVKFSLDKDHPNLVEIFSDGFDLSHFDNHKDYEADNNFNEFKWFKHFATAGHPTHLSLSMILNDFRESNPFKEMYDNSLTPNEYQPYEYSQGSLKNGIKHLSVNKDEFNTRTIINPAAFSSSTEYGQSLSGMPESIKEKDPTLNVTNWVGARDANAAKEGFNSHPVDIQGYKWLANYAEQTQGKGARVYIADMITHRPFVVDDKQQFTVWNTKREDVVKSLRQSFDDVIMSLKNIKDASGFSAFDNSMILIFGDHASHDFMDFQTGDSVTRACESSFIIKYPKQSDGAQQNQTKMESIDSKYIWAPQIGDIINDYFKPSTIKNNANYFDEYFNNNSNPDKFTNVLRPVFNSSSAYGMAHWIKNNSGDWEYNIADKNKPLTIFASDKQTQKAQVEELAKVVY